ncbi:hypothetical protein NX059_009859 [Plenodomus lindquistii]|nr:hypothetical protein NX059_009859 [Plenodomus lindquistii]
MSDWTNWCHTDYVWDTADAGWSFDGSIEEGLSQIAYLPLECPASHPTHMPEFDMKRDYELEGSDSPWSSVGHADYIPSTADFRDCGFGTLTTMQDSRCWPIVPEAPSQEKRHEYSVEFGQLQDVVRRESSKKDHRIGLITHNRGRHTARRVLREASALARSGNTDATGLLDRIDIVITVPRQRGWPEVAWNFALTLGEMIAVCPVMLYQANRLTWGDTHRSNHQRLTPVAVDSAYVKNAGVVPAFISQILPRTLSTAITEPTPEVFVLAAFVLGSLVAMQYHLNRASKTQKPALLMAVTFGLAVTPFMYTSRRMAITTLATTVIPTVTIAALLLSQLADAVRYFLHSHRDTTLRHAVGRAHYRERSFERFGHKEVLFVSSE